MVFAAHRSRRGGRFTNRDRALQPTPSEPSGAPGVGRVRAPTQPRRCAAVPDYERMVLRLGHNNTRGSDQQDLLLDRRGSGRSGLRRLRWWRHRPEAFVRISPKGEIEGQRAAVNVAKLRSLERTTESGGSDIPDCRRQAAARPGNPMRAFRTMLLCCLVALSACYLVGFGHAAYGLYEPPHGFSVLRAPCACVYRPWPGSEAETGVALFLAGDPPEGTVTVLRCPSWILALAAGSVLLCAGVGVLIRE